MIAAATRQTSPTRQTGPVDGDVDWEQVPGCLQPARDQQCVAACHERLPAGCRSGPGLPDVAEARL